MEGVMRCKLKGPTLGCDRDKKRLMDRKKGEGGWQSKKQTAWQMSPLGARSFLWSSFRIPFFLTYTALFIFLKSLSMSSLWVLASGPWPSAFLFPSSFLLALLFLRSHETHCAYMFLSSPVLTHLWASLPGGFAHKLLIIQFTLFQEIQYVFLLCINRHTNACDLTGSPFR